MKKKHYAALLAVVVIAFTGYNVYQESKGGCLYLIWQWLTKHWQMENFRMEMPVKVLGHKNVVSVDYIHYTYKAFSNRRLVIAAIQ